jgi:hypothetical protein
MLYHQDWTNTTDIPSRAIAQGIVPDRFGTLDPTDGGHALRSSFSAQYHETLGDGQFSASASFIYNRLHLFNDFTQYLFDPVHGDQEDQFENRRVLGGAAGYTLPVALGAFATEVKAGARMRYDLLGVGRLPSEAQVPLVPLPPSDPVSLSNDDQVHLFAGAAYLQATTHWTSHFRSVLGLRDDYQQGSDVDYLAALHETAGYTNGGHQAQSLLQPKGSLIYTASDALEFYAAAGEGFHSADLRGVNQDRSVDLGLPNTPLLAKQEGEDASTRPPYTTSPVRAPAPMLPPPWVKSPPRASGNSTPMCVTPSLRAGAPRSASTISSTPTPQRPSSGTSIGSNPRSKAIRTAVPMCTNIRSSHSWRA